MNGSQCILIVDDNPTNVRILAHSLLGCFFYGAFAAKVLIVRNRSLPGWALPWVGGLVFTTVVALWLTSSFWFFTNVEFPGF